MITFTLLVKFMFALSCMVGVFMTIYFMATRGIFILGIKDGFISIISDGVENGTYRKTVGAMMGYRIERNGEIVEDAGAKKPLFLAWVGIFPFSQPMVFDTEQAKLVNKTDGTLGLEIQKFQGTIYIPIKSTERLVVRGLELVDKASKIDFEVNITFRMTNAYTAKVENRGSIKILKSTVEEGLREKASELDYPQALKIKGATSKPDLAELVKQLNEADCGYGTLSKTTGYIIESIQITGIELSGDGAKALNESFSKIQQAANAALEAKELAVKKIIDADAERGRIEREGAGKADAYRRMVEETAKRVEMQKGLTDAQALALAIENGLSNTDAQVVNIGNTQGGTATVTQIPLKQPGGKKSDKKK